MDWFKQLTGFAEGSYEETRANLVLDGRRLTSLVNGKAYCVGEFELASLGILRERAKSSMPASGRLRVSVVRGDVRQMHLSPQYRGALFQAASQFNMLEMISPNVTPEDGVTRYQHDRTQGPACAIAAGAATIFRNYFVPVDGSSGQTAVRQLDGLAKIEEVLGQVLGRPVSALWRMQNGYALCTRSGLDAIAEYLAASSQEDIDDLRAKLFIGVHWDVEATEAPREPYQLISQAFCSALPVLYTSIAPSHWRPFASLVLEAAYEATMWAAVMNARRGASNVVLLTLLGGGAFGNPDEWILRAMRRALTIVSMVDLDVRVVSYGEPTEALIDLVRVFA